MGINEKIKSIWNAIFVPTCIAPIKFILLLENVFSIYRNLWCYTKRSRRIIYLRILLDMTYTILNIVMYATLGTPVSKIMNIIYFYMNGLNSIIIMSLALYFSKKFSILLSLIEDNHRFFSNDKEYQKNMAKRDSSIKNGFLITNILAIFGYVFIYVRNLCLNTVNVHFMFILNARLCDYRCINEHLAIYSVLCVISAQIECITRAVSKDNVQTLSVIEDRKTQMEIAEFEEMFTIFSNIKKCSELCNEIFGLQLVLMLASATVYCILFLYNTAFFSVTGFHNLLGLISSILKLLTFFLPLLLISWGAQTKINNVNDLRRQLGHLLIDCEANDPYYKATKGLLRLVSTRSIRTEAYGSINIDMTLIPSFIMFVTSYTVIALQFNNVV